MGKENILVHCGDSLRFACASWSATGSPVPRVASYAWFIPDRDRCFRLAADYGRPLACDGCKEAKISLIQIRVAANNGANSGDPKVKLVNQTCQNPNSFKGYSGMGTISGTWAPPGAITPAMSDTLQMGTTGHCVPWGNGAGGPPLRFVQRWGEMHSRTFLLDGAIPALR